MRIRLNNKFQLPCINFSFGKMTTNTGVISVIAHKIYPKKNGCISICRRLVETPTGAARHRPQSVWPCDKLKCARSSYPEIFIYNIALAVLFLLFFEIAFSISTAKNTSEEAAQTNKNSFRVRDSV